MKATTKYADIITSAVREFDTSERRSVYAEAFRSGKLWCNDFDMRYRWDLLWHAIGAGALTYEQLGSEELNGSHIDTVLRRAVPIVLLAPER
jgi:hypothetical protein